MEKNKKRVPMGRKNRKVQGIWKGKGGPSRIIPPLNRGGKKI